MSADPGSHPHELHQVPAAEETAGPSHSDEARYRTRFDLAAHLARAEIRQGNALVEDFGVPGGAKYTLGGWQTQTGDDHDFGGTRALVIPGVTASLLVPAPDAKAAELHLSARAFADGRLTVYVGERTVAHVTLPTKHFGVVDVALPAGTLAPGENTVKLRVPATGTVDGVHGGLAVDWLRLGPAGETGAAPPPSPSKLFVRNGAEHGLGLPAGWTLGFAFEGMPGARLRGKAVGPSGSRVVATAHVDGSGPIDLGVLRAGRAFDLDLASIRGRIARLDLHADGGDVKLLSPRVVTPDAPARDRTFHKPKNAIIFLVDTLRADHLEPYDPHTVVRTPGLDRWVHDTTVFEEAHAQENWTKPSVATLLSSLYPWEHDTTTSEAVLPPSVKILPEMLRAHGFYTGAFICNGYISGKFGFRRGWSTFRNYIREGRRTQASFVAADVLDWLDTRPTGKRFFLYVHTIDPHVPYIPPEDVLHSYDPLPYDGPVDFHRDRGLLEKVKSGHLALDARDKTHLEALYDAEITYHDVHFGAVMDGLVRRGLADDTVVIMTADHGEEFYDHGSVGHGHSVWEELLHVPLIVRLPGLEAKTVRIPADVGLVDVVPTLLDILGEPAPGDLSGRSLLPLLLGGVPAAPRVTVSGFLSGWRTAVVGRMKLIQRTAAHAMLYDLGTDPHETQDIAAGHPIALRYLRGLLGLTLAGEDHPRHVAHHAEQTVIDPRTDAQLRAIGYVGSSRPK